MTYAIINVNCNICELNMLPIKPFLMGLILKLAPKNFVPPILFWQLFSLICFYKISSAKEPTPTAKIHSQLLCCRRRKLTGEDLLRWLRPFAIVVVLFVSDAPVGAVLRAHRLRPCEVRASPPLAPLKPISFFFLHFLWNPLITSTAIYILLFSR